jgi:23S rRNA pseudouridine955/2504/2580 synthase
MSNRQGNSFVRKWRVLPEEGGMRLLTFLHQKNPDVPSVKSLKRALDGKRCTVNGKTETFASHRLMKEDLVVLDFAQEKKEKTVLTILYEDPDLLIVDKPAGVISENRYFAPLLKKRAALIHRLDKETSGAVMLGKNPEIIEQMIGLFREKQVHKQYLAIVDGSVAEPQGIIETSLRKKPASIPGQVLYETVKGKENRGLAAITRWKCLKKTNDASLVLCEPITGRTHQLRVHLQSIGHPILGDIQYAKRFRCPYRPRRHLLHACTLSFTHPKTKQKIHVTSPIPPDFQEALERLRLSYIAL